MSISVVIGFMRLARLKRILVLNTYIERYTRHLLYRRECRISSNHNTETGRTIALFFT